MDIQPDGHVKVTVTIEKDGSRLVHEFPHVAEFRLGAVPSTIKQEPIVFDAGELPCPPGIVDLTGVETTIYPGPILKSLTFTITGRAEPAEPDGNIYAWRVDR